ncbi:MAG: hypothetical protein ACLQHL_11645 [Candidatus Cybelea sp.]
MKSDLGRHAWIMLAVILLEGCNASQAQIEPAALTQHVTQSGLMRISFLEQNGVAQTLRNHRGQSWIARDASRLKGPLLYVSDGGDNFLYVFSLPGGQLVEKITGFRAIAGLCSDKEGNVFVVDFDAASVKVFPHGRKEPTAVLNDPDADPTGCSVDPTTGNLAVTNDITVTGSDMEEPGDVAIYKNAKGTPQDYADPNMVYVSSDSYDSTGDLYVSGVADSYQNSSFAVLYKGRSKLKDLTLNQSFSAYSLLQWDGQYLAVASENDAQMYRFKINGATGTKVGTTKLVGASAVYGFWIQNNELYAAGVSNDQPMVGFYPYPRGGKPTKTLLGFSSALSATVSVLP